MKKEKIQVSKAFYNEVESNTLLLHKLGYPLDLFDDLYKIHLESND